jgi:tetrahydrodipicolinate N-succinyltransferase
MHFNEILDKLEAGELRSASPDAGGTWTTHTEVKAAILTAIREGKIALLRERRRLRGGRFDGR